MTAFAEDSAVRRMPKLGPVDPWRLSVERRLTRIEIVQWLAIAAGIFGPQAQKLLAALGTF